MKHTIRRNGSGILDKNGIEICEGDKVKFPHGQIKTVSGTFAELDQYRSAEIEIVEYADS